MPITIASVVLLISYSWHWGSTKRTLVGCGMGAQLEDVLEPDEDSRIRRSLQSDEVIFQTSESQQCTFATYFCILGPSGCLPF